MNSYGTWRIRIAKLPDGRLAIGTNEMPQQSDYGTREEVVIRLRQCTSGYTYEIAREYQDSLGRVIKKRRGKWEEIAE